jgi:hypothetical protein
MSVNGHVIIESEKKEGEMKMYKIKITCCAFGCWTEKIKIVTESELIRLENEKNGLYTIDILEVLNPA